MAKEIEVDCRGIELNAFHARMAATEVDQTRHYPAALAVMMFAKGIKHEAGCKTVGVLFEAVNLLVKQKYDGYPMTEQLAREYVEPLVLMLQEGIIGATTQ